MNSESKFYRHIGLVSPKKLTDLHIQNMVYFSVVSIAFSLTAVQFYILLRTGGTSILCFFGNFTIDFQWHGMNLLHQSKFTK